MKKKGMETWFAYNFVLFSLHGIRYFGKYKKRNLFVCLAFLSKSKEMSSESHPRETKTDIRPTSRCDAQPNCAFCARCCQNERKPSRSQNLTRGRVFDLSFVFHQKLSSVLASENSDNDKCHGTFR